MSALIAARDGDERLDQGELLSTLLQLIVAGHDTTASLIGNSAGVRALRAMATSSPRPMMHGAHRAKIWTSYQNALAIEPKVRRNTAQSKNDSRTFCQPDVFGSNHTTSAATAAVVPNESVR